MTSENYQTIAAFVSIWVIIIIIVKARQKKEWDEKDNIEKQKLKELDLRIRAKKEEIRNSLIDFARRNKKVHFNSYDIEEGGHYLTEINEVDLDHINQIIEEEYSEQIRSRFSYNCKVIIDLRKGENRIMNEMPKSGTDHFFGYD